MHDERFTVLIRLAVTTKDSRLFFEAIIDGILTVQPKVVIIILFLQLLVLILTARGQKRADNLR